MNRTAPSPQSAPRPGTPWHGLEPFGSIVACRLSTSRPWSGGARRTRGCTGPGQLAEQKIARTNSRTLFDRDRGAPYVEARGCAGCSGARLRARTIPGGLRRVGSVLPGAAGHGLALAGGCGRQKPSLPASSGFQGPRADPMRARGQGRIAVRRARPAGASAGAPRGVGPHPEASFSHEFDESFSCVVRHYFPDRGGCQLAGQLASWGSRRAM